MRMLSKRIGFMGAGEISEVLIHNILHNGIVDPADILIHDIRSERMDELRDKFGVVPTGGNGEVVAGADYIFSCVRSEYAADLAEEIAGADMESRVLITISAGVPMLLYESKLNDAAIARSLPNPPSKIGEGAIVIAFNQRCSDVQKSEIMTLFSPMGKCFTIREDQIDTATAVTCPAYPLSLFQAAVEGSVLLGIDLKTSQEMVMQTIRGVLKVWEGRPDKLAEILDQSATPGGITAGMVYFLDKAGFKGGVKGCIEEGALRTKAFGERIKEQLK